MPAIQRIVASAVTAVLLLSGLSAISSAANAQEPSSQSAATTAASASVVEGSLVKTADLSAFQPGNIISDAAFYDRGTMTEAQIQSFLQSKVPSCQSGYVCLKDWYDTSRTTGADAMCGSYSGGIRERAAAIIYKVAQACGINPQVLIVMLQKEQGLVTHTWPSDWRYTIAMGQGCPDTAACDTRYYGFFNQVYGAAWQLKRYANPPGTSAYFTWFAPGKTWNVRWHPNASCGSAPVYIQNQATANLYYYTPYQPNAAALRAGYGEGDGCSAYGNRNFYQYFTDWFAAAPVVLPTLTSLDQSSYVIGLDTGGTLWGYPMTASGTWGAHVPLVSGLAGIEKILAVGDHDGDGHRDFIGVDGANAARLYRGDGARISASGSRVNVDWSGQRLVTAGGLFDGDDTPDVLTLSSDGQLLLWPGVSHGGFGSPVVVSDGFGSVDLLMGGTDMSGDGVPDVVARNASGDLYLHTGDGAGGIQSSAWIGSGWSVMSRIFSPGDFTGDGKADVLASTAGGELVLYPNIGGGAIANGPVVGTGWQVMADISNAGAVPSGVRVFAPGAGDANLDGAADVIARNSAGALLLYQGDGAGGWRNVTIAAPSWGTSRFVTLGDFDGDGRADLARVDPSGDLLLASGDGSGGYASPRWIGGGWNGFDLLVGGTDFDGDRKLDVLARNTSGLLYLYRGNGAGGWVTGVGQVIGNGWGIFDSVFSIGDFDGNHRAGLAARRPDGSLWLYPASGTGGWGAPRQIGSGWDGITAVFSPGDFDGTGSTDILARMPNGDLRLYQGDGKGGWAGVVTVGTGWTDLPQIG